MGNMDEAEEVRRKNLLVLIDERGGKDGGTTRLSNETGISPAQISQWANRSLHSETGKPRAMSRRSARKIEAALSLPPNWMDSPHDAGLAVSAAATPGGYVRLGVFGEGGMGLPVENQDFPEVIREMQFSEYQLRKIFGFLPRPGRVALMTGRGHSMEPLISHGDVVMVDTQITYYDEAGPYIINLGDGQQIKTLQHRGDGIYVVSLNEKVGGPAFLAPKDMVIGGKVYVVQKFVMAH